MRFDGNGFAVRADEKLTAFSELESGELSQPKIIQTRSVLAGETHPDTDCESVVRRGGHLDQTVLIH